MGAGLFSALSLWAMSLLVVSIMIAAILTGLKIGRHFKTSYSDDDSPPIGTVVGALFALLAFMLALTYNAASSRFDVRKQLLLDEVNAIDTAYLRAGFLASEDSAASRSLLKEYVQLRAEVLSMDNPLADLLSRSEELQGELWRIAMLYPKGAVGEPRTVAYASALNEVFDRHASRVVVGAKYHVHPTVWTILLMISTLSMAALGFQFGYSGGRRTWLCLLLAVTFSMVLLLIEDLDRPGEGSIQVDQSPMSDLLVSFSRGEN